MTKLLYALAAVAVVACQPKPSPAPVAAPTALAIAPGIDNGGQIFRNAGWSGPDSISFYVRWDNAVYSPVQIFRAELVVESSSHAVLAHDTAKIVRAAHEGTDSALIATVAPDLGDSIKVSICGRNIIGSQVSLPACTGRWFYGTVPAPGTPTIIPIGFVIRPTRAEIPAGGTIQFCAFVLYSDSVYRLPSNQVDSPTCRAHYDSFPVRNRAPTGYPVALQPAKSRYAPQINIAVMRKGDSAVVRFPESHLPAVRLASR